MPAQARPANPRGPEVRRGLKGTLAVQVKRGKGDVYLDGKRVGQTPYKGEVAVGRHRVEVRGPGGSHAKDLVVYHNVNTELFLRRWPETPRTMRADKPSARVASPNLLALAAAGLDLLTSGAGVGKRLLALLTAMQWWLSS